MSYIKIVLYVRVTLSQWILNASSRKPVLAIIFLAEYKRNSAVRIDWLLSSSWEGALHFAV